MCAVHFGIEKSTQLLCEIFSMKLMKKIELKSAIQLEDLSALRKLQEIKNL
jgi:uncharacterized protein (UPF0254 family)